MNKAFEEFVAARLSSYLAGCLSVHAQRTHFLPACFESRCLPRGPSCYSGNAAR
jgi:hypothetical protein